MNSDDTLPFPMRALTAILLLASPVVHAQDDPAGPRNAAFESVRSAGLLEELVARTGNLLEKKKYDAAMATADEAMRIKPDDPAVLNAKAAVLIETGKYDEADALLKQALEKAPNMLEPRYNHAESLFLQKKYSEAAYEFRVLQREMPNNPLLKFKLFLAYDFSDQKDLSGTVLDALRFPLDGPAWYYSHAAQKFQNDDSAGAKKLLRAARAIHGEDADQYEEALQDAGLLK